MKELSIEEKAKAYDEAKEKAKIWQKHLYDVNDKDYADELNYIFPALKESEDEKIRESLIEGFGNYSSSFETFGGLKVSDILSWLEKQGEQNTWKPSDEQMKALQESIGIVGQLTIKGGYLKELYEQLKKLRE